MSIRSQGDAPSAGGVSVGGVARRPRRIVALYLPELLCELARGIDGRDGYHGPSLASSRRTSPQEPGPSGLGARGARSRPGRAPRAGRARPFAVVLREDPAASSATGEATIVRSCRGQGAESPGPPGGATSSDGMTADALLPTARIAAVSAAARRLGITEGQTITEARAVVAGLEVFRVSRSRVRAALAAVAEVALGFGITTAIEPPFLVEGAESAGDTVWVDVTGTEGLFGGERQLLVELVSAVGELGHAVRPGVAEGPLLARAVARWGVGARHEVGVVATPALVATLPVVALPLDLERAAWLNKLGVHTLGELGALPRAALTSRLAAPARGTDRPGVGGAPQPRIDVRLLLELCRGRDSTPLVPYRPPRVLSEEVSFEEPVPGVEPLQFALRGLATRLSARLAGRGEAALALAVTLWLDASVARLNGAAPGSALEIGLAAPLWREHDLYRVLVARLERLKLPAPTVRLRIDVTSVTERATRQLELARMSGEGLAGARDEDALPVLLAEIAGDIGSDRVGVLCCADSHRPEAQTLLVPPGAARGERARGRRGRRVGPAPRAVEAARAPGADAGVPRIGGGRRVRAPVRLFAHPVPFTAALRPESAIFLGGRAYTIARIDFERRLEAVEWWSHRPTSRDYYRLLLLGEPARGEAGERGARGETSVLEVLVYVDRQTGERCLQGIFD